MAMMIPRPDRHTAISQMYGSDIKADPSLQIYREDILDEIADDVLEVGDVKRKNMSGTAMKVLGLALVIIGLTLIGTSFLLPSHTATGIVATIGGLISFTGGLPLKYGFSLAKAENKEKVDRIYKDTIKYRINRNVFTGQFDEEVEMQPLYYGRRPQAALQPQGRRQQVAQRRPFAQQQVRRGGGVRQPPQPPVGADVIR